MRTAFGKEIRFDPIPPAEKAPRSFRVLHGKGRHLESFGVFAPLAKFKTRVVVISTSTDNDTAAFYRSDIRERIQKAEGAKAVPQEPEKSSVATPSPETPKPGVKYFKGHCPRMHLGSFTWNGSVGLAERGHRPKGEAHAVLPSRLMNQA
jgi:hypothetical protein